MLRRLHHTQPDNFAFTPANAAWAEEQIAKYPEGRQASAIIPLLWRGQEQEGWVSRPMVEEIAKMLGMATIRVLEVATFYFMFQLRPVGAVAHVQVCGTTSCMICGAEDLIGVCKEVIHPNAHEISEDGNFSWEEVECLGACSNAPMVQIGKDFYEDLTAESFRQILAAFARGETPRPGPQNGRYAAEPLGGATTLAADPVFDGNASVSIALAKGDTVGRNVDGEPAFRWPMDGAPAPAPKPAPKPAPAPKSAPAQVAQDSDRPEALRAPRDGAPDNLKKIKGVGPKLEALLHSLGFFHFDQIAGWTAAEVAWVDQNLKGFKGRVSRDDWVAQAKILADGGETEFSKRAT